MIFNHRRAIVFISFIVSIALPAITFFYINYRNTHFHCDAVYSASRFGKLLVSKSQLVVNGRYGTLMINGRITDVDSKVSFFTLRNYFEIKRNNPSYNFTSLNVSMSPESIISSKILDDFFSDAIIKKKGGSFLNIYPINDNYVIANGNMPIAFCMKHEFNR